MLSFNYLVCLLGPDPGLEELLAKQIPQLLALSATVSKARTEVLPEVIGEGAGTRFSHPWGVSMWSGEGCALLFGLAPLYIPCRSTQAYFLIKEIITDLIFWL